jgi:protein-tyrosine phosphatase
VAQNELSTIPKTLSKLPKLHYVVFSGNRLPNSEIPRLFNLPQIDTMLLDENEFSCFPEEILTTNTTLKLLDIRKNKRMQLLPALFHMHDASYHDVPSEIIPQKLYLGNVGGSESLELLKTLKITQILRAIDVTAQKEQPFSDEEFNYLWIDCVDTDGQDMAQYFDRAFEFLDADQVSFVHCRQGKSRSGTLVLSYLMRKKKMTYEEALAYVCQRRKIVRPNPHFKEQLKKYEESLNLELVDL